MKTIGLFDSGVGGLTCLRTLIENFPGHRFVYLGDTARLPYGTKSQETIKKYTLQNIETLMGFDVDLIVSACHSASSAILSQNITAPVPLYEVITPASRVAAAGHSTIGVLATATTVKSEIYPSQIQKLKPEIRVFQQASPLLVSLVETGWLNDPITNLIVQRYCRDLLKENISGLILGCTHFPALSETIKNVVGPEVELIDPAVPLAENLKETLSSKDAIGTQLDIHLTDLSPHFIDLAKGLLGEKISKSISIRQI